MFSLPARVVYRRNIKDRREGVFIILPFDVRAPPGLDLARRDFFLRARLGEASHEYPLSRVGSVLSLDESVRGVRLPFADVFRRQRSKRLVVEILVDVPLIETGPEHLGVRLRLCEGHVGLVSSGQASHLSPEELATRVDVPSFRARLPPLAETAVEDATPIEADLTDLSAPTRQTETSRLVAAELAARERRSLALRHASLDEVRDLVRRRLDAIIRELTACPHPA